jgi:hypothetical protein
MLPYLIVFSLLNIIIAFEPQCSSCKFYIPNKKGSLELGLCKMFTTNVSPKSDVIEPLPNFAIHCRNNENLCGKSGLLYEKAESDNKNSKIEPDPESGFEREIINEYEDLKNRCCGEVNEDDELEQLERDFFEVFQKIKKHNRKRIFKTSQELYKLFKKK